MQLDIPERKPASRWCVIRHGGLVCKPHCLCCLHQCGGTVELLKLARQGHFYGILFLLSRARKNDLLGSVHDVHGYGNLVLALLGNAKSDCAAAGRFDVLALRMQRATMAVIANTKEQHVERRHGARVVDGWVALEECVVGGCRLRHCEGGEWRPLAEKWADQRVEDIPDLALVAKGVESGSVRLVLTQALSSEEDVDLAPIHSSRVQSFQR
mmetsp:Transcript_105451/g.191785  ORF Transcript_105451/g.191785 Transcript_105451/m.191785 type:complete len:212 (+) Transcript_105451:220-855(+)